MPLLYACSTLRPIFFDPGDKAYQSLEEVAAMSWSPPCFDVAAAFANALSFSY